MDHRRIVDELVVFAQGAGLQKAHKPNVIAERDALNQNLDCKERHIVACRLVCERPVHRLNSWRTNTQLEKTTAAVFAACEFVTVRVVSRV